MCLILKSNMSSEINPSVDTLSNLNEYLLNRSGKLAATYFLGGRFDTTNRTGLPDVQFDLSSLPKNSPPSLMGTDEFFSFQSQEESLIETSKKYVLTYVMVSAIKPKSVGVIKLNDTLEADIYSGYLTNEEDTYTLVRGIRTMLNIVKTPAFQNYETQPVHIPLSECDALAYDSDEYWKCYIRYMSLAGLHAVGTCKMGRDSKSVVDPQLRVHKTTGLRVIDCSM